MELIKLQTQCFWRLEICWVLGIVSSTRTISTFALDICWSTLNKLWLWVDLTTSCNWLVNWSITIATRTLSFSGNSISQYVWICDMSENFDGNRYEYIGNWDEFAKETFTCKYAPLWSIDVPESETFSKIHLGWWAVLYFSTNSKTPWLKTICYITMRY